MGVVESIAAVGEGVGKLMRTLSSEANVSVAAGDGVARAAVSVAVTDEVIVACSSSSGVTAAVTGDGVDSASRCREKAVRVHTSLVAHMFQHHRQMVGRGGMNVCVSQVWKKIAEAIMSDSMAPFIGDIGPRKHTTAIPTG